MVVIEPSNSKSCVAADEKKTRAFRRQIRQLQEEAQKAYMIAGKLLEQLDDEPAPQDDWGWQSEED